MQEVRTLRVKAVLENVTAAMDFVTRAARNMGCSEDSLGQIELSVDEACANVVDHAYKGMEQGDMEISCGLDDEDFVIRVRDWGRSFDVAAVPTPDVSAPLEDRSLGGLGLYLIRQVMDRVEFSSDPDTGNQLVMVKKLDRTS